MYQFLVYVLYLVTTVFICGVALAFVLGGVSGYVISSLKSCGLALIKEYFERREQYDRSYFGRASKQVN